MAYRNKTYVAFDADNDMRYYRLMQAWKQNDNPNHVMPFVYQNVLKAILLIAIVPYLFRE